MKKGLFIYFLVSIYSGFTFAIIGGTDVGNGGDAVVCRNADTTIRTAELLDFYEARVMRGQDIKLDNTKSTEANISLLFQRLSYHDTFLRDRLIGWQQTFMAESRFLIGATLVDVPDSNHISLPVNCNVEQVAIQRVPQFPGEKFYTINKDIWDKLDTSSQAGLTLHELLYKNLTLFGKGNSNSTYIRYLTSVVAGDVLKDMLFKDYLSIIQKEIFIEYTNINGYLSKIDSVAFDSMGSLAAYTYLLPQGGKYRVSSDLEFDVVPNGNVRTVIQGNVIQVLVDTSTTNFNYQGLNLNLKGEQIYLELNKTDKTLNQIYANNLSFTNSFAYDLSMQQVVTCNTLEFKGYWPQYFKCNEPTLENGFLLKGESDKFNMTLQSIIINRSNLKFYKALSDHAELNFYLSGRVQEIKCLADGGAGVLNYPYLKPGNIILKMNSDFIIESETAPSPIRIRCASKGEIIEFYENGFAKKNGIDYFSISEVANSRLYYSFQFKGAYIKCSTTEKYAVDAPVYEAYSNGQVKSVVYTENSFPYKEVKPFYDTSGKLIPIQVGDLINFNEKGEVEKIEKNYCRNK